MLELLSILEIQLSCVKNFPPSANSREFLRSKKKLCQCNHVTTQLFFKIYVGKNKYFCFFIIRCS